MIRGIVVLSFSSVVLSIFTVVVTVVRIVITSVVLDCIGPTSLPSMNGVWFRCQPIRAPCALGFPGTRFHDNIGLASLSAFFHPFLAPLVGLSNILDNELNGGKPMEGSHR